MLSVFLHPYQWGTHKGQYTLANQTVHEWFMCQMCICVDRTVTSCCEPKFVIFLHKHKGNYAYCVDKFFYVREPHACCLCFLHFFQYGWVNVCWVRNETMVCVFTLHLWKIDILCI